jgi:uncharacterized LabA/DUF88 family protein
MTLVLYDVDNIKTANNNQSKKSNKFDFFELVKAIRELVDDTTVDVAFMSLYTEGTYKFRTLLESRGIEVVGRRSVLKTNYYQGMQYKYYDNDTDAQIATYILTFGPKYDNVVLVSGDKDLSIPFSRLEKQFKIAIAWKDNMSNKIKAVADEYFYLEDILKINKEE